MSDTPLSLYRAELAAGRLAPDPVQERAVEALDALARALGEARADVGGWKAWLGLAPKETTAPRGLYLHGGVGRGKSMLMDMFFSAAPVRGRHKRRVHFHEFMIEVHERLHVWRRRTRDNKEQDPLPKIAAEVARDTRLLCFDEFQVTNVADAMILGRLFESLFDKGVVVVATSNRAPDDLYRNGLQRQRFVPFIELLKERLDVMHLDGEIDYRLARLRDMDVYFTPLGAESEAELDRAFQRLVTDADGIEVTPEPVTLTAQGRDVEVPLAARGAARFTFTELCGKPLGAADYIAIAREFHTVILSGIPEMGPANRDKAARFVTLVDALYEHRVKLICTAAADPQELYDEGDGSFEFQRTASRLMEMQTPEYKALDHLTAGGGRSAA